MLCLSATAAQGAVSASDAAVTTTTTAVATATTATSGRIPRTASAAVVRVNGSVGFRIGGLFRVQHHPVSVTGRWMGVRGTVRPFAPGQWVVVQFALRGKVFKTQHLRIKPTTGSSNGHFFTRYRAVGTGRVTVTVTHAATVVQGAFSKQRVYANLGKNAHPGSRGRFVQLVQKRLAQLHFFVGRTGVYDLRTELAVNAYHRLLGRGYATTLDRTTIHDLLKGVGTFHVRFRRQGRHAEVDLTHQILALVDGSKVKLMFPISSGKPSTPTILGSFRIWLRTPGYLSDGMYYSSFFYSGYAIHGYDPAPNYPASHGCVRLPITDAITAFNWLAMGDWVDTYYR